MIETETLLALSTAHLRQETFDEFDVCAYPNEYGAFVPVTTDSGLEDLNAVLTWARERHINWLKFDRDAPEIDGLETYEW